MRQVPAVVLAASCFAVASVQAEWTCDESYFAAKDGCDCDCGEWDPDCDETPSQTLYCNGDQDTEGRVCEKEKLTCVVPMSNGWTCKAEYYNGNDGCDCGCGTWDPDCDRDGQTLYCGGVRDTEGRTCSASSLECEASSVPAGKTFGLRASVNLAEHKTAKFYTTAGFTPSDALVVRRGQAFEVEVLEGVEVPTLLTAKLGGETLSVTKASARVWKVALGAKAAVGRFALTLNGEGYGTVAVLFNPYVAADTQVYVEDAAERAEYLENENGRYWYGDVASASLAAGAGSSGWAFGQYDVLNYVMALVDRMPTSVDRSQPTEVARAMTYLLNSGVSGGVLQGRWDGEYDDGTAPWVWTGSRDIFKAWADAGQTSVKYGQCWVFACLLTTTMRTLGIAARPITNFRSAHESKPFDFYIDERTADSIWNFHAWTDAKMSREDISAEAGYVQWNAIDATPQETSGGLYQMGPASLPQMANNVAHGSSYDQKFVVSETNGILLRNGAEIHSDIGRYISTKKPGCTTPSFGDAHFCRMDITEQYKKFESPLVTEGRAASALGRGRGRGGKGGRLQVTARGYDELAGFSLGAEDLAVGGDVRFYVVSSAGVRLDGSRGAARVVFTAEAVSYTGVKIADLEVGEAVVSPNGKTATLSIPESVYGPFLGRTNTLRIRAEVQNMVGLTMYSHMNKFELATPNPVATLHKDGTATVTITNPLSTALTHGALHFSTPARDHSQKVATIAAHGTKTVRLSTKGWCNLEHGTQKEVVLSYTSNELGGNMHTHIDIEC